MCASCTCIEIASSMYQSSMTEMETLVDRTLCMNRKADAVRHGCIYKQSCKHTNLGSRGADARKQLHAVLLLLPTVETDLGCWV